jgi:hypothetical protein
MYPHMVLHWRLPSAIHIHRVQPSCYNQYHCKTRIIHTSTLRSEHLYQQQLKLMTKLNITMVDFYKDYYACADMNLHGDALHYNKQFNKMIMDWMYH